MKAPERREKMGMVIAIPRVPQSRRNPAHIEGSQDSHLLLTEALRAKDERLRGLLQDRELFTDFLQGEVLEPLYRLESEIASTPTKRRENGAGEPRTSGPSEHLGMIIQGVRAKLLSLEAEVITGFELESELRQLASAGRQFGKLDVSVLVDPHGASLLTQEEGRRLVCIARSVILGGMHLPSVREMAISLHQARGQIRFSVQVPGTQESAARLGVDIEEIRGQVRHMGGRVMMRSRPRFELSIVLNTAPASPAPRPGGNAEDRLSTAPSAAGSTKP